MHRSYGLQHLRHKRPTFAFTGKSGYTLGFAQRIAHRRSQGETWGISDGGGITTLGLFHTFRKPCVARGQNGVLCRFGILAGRCSRRTQKAFGTAMRLCVSLSRRRRGPAGLRDLFRFCRSCGLYTLRSVLSECARRGVVSLPPACFACCRNAGRPLVKAAHLLFSCGQVIIFASSDRTAYKQKYHVCQQAEAQGAYFRYSSKNTFSFSNGMTSI